MKSGGPWISIPYWTPRGVVIATAEDWFLGDRLEFFWPPRRRLPARPFDWRFDA